MTRLGDIAELRSEKVQPSEARDVAYIGLEHIEQQTLATNGVGTGADVSSQKQRFYRGDVLFGKLRPYFRKVILAEDEGICSTDIWVLRPKEGFDSAFILYLLASEGFIEKATSTSEGSRMPRANWKVMKGYEFPDFTAHERATIGQLLRRFDQKILENRKASTLLEEMAQRLFKSWFIDFDPVKAKMAGEVPAGMDAETAALFPDSMEDSQIGEIPSGWRVVEAGEIAFTTIGGLWGVDDSEDGRSSSYYCLRGTDLDDLKSTGLAERTPVRWDKAESISKRQSANNHVLIGGSGAGPVGKSLLWDSSIDALFDSPVIYSNFVKRFETSTQAEATFLYFLLQEMLSSGEIFEYVGGTSVPNLLDRTLLESKRFALPPEPLLRVFDALYRAALQIRYSGQSRYLAQLRDALLPRLISGELEIPDEMLAA